ncbi:MAG: hypothetical protein ACRCU9_08610 [Iodobacter sp.]
MNSIVQYFGSVRQFTAAAQTCALQLKAFRRGRRCALPQLPNDLGISPELAEIKDPL